MVWGTLLSSNCADTSQDTIDFGFVFQGFRPRLCLNSLPLLSLFPLISGLLGVSPGNHAKQDANLCLST